MVYSVDRFEGDIAVLVDENEEPCAVERTRLPADVTEGDMVRSSKDGKFFLDEEATRTRRERILALQNRLRRSET